MNNLPMQPLTAQQQKRLSIELYALLGAQVKRYHAHYHMGENSSVPTEIARELMESIEFTLAAAGGYRPGTPLEEQLAQGQEVLEAALGEAKALHRLVAATAPEYDSQCRWEAVEALGKYLENYDLRHFAHRSPEEPDYPLLAPLPDGLTGIYRAKGYLHCLWLENQLLDTLPAGELWALAPPGYWDAPQNLCEQPLWNAMGKVLAGAAPAPVPLSPEERQAIAVRLEEGDARALLEGAMDAVCREFAISPALREYAQGAIDSLHPRLKAAVIHGNLGYLFW